MSVQGVPKRMLGFLTGVNVKPFDMDKQSRKRNNNFLQTLIGFNVRFICCFTVIRKIMDIKFNLMCFVASLAFYTTYTRGPVLQQVVTLLETTSTKSHPESTDWMDEREIFF